LYDEMEVLFNKHNVYRVIKWTKKMNNQTN
jgi:hypothetical protein